ncbi:hypothetical protein DAPPUDRAFT_240976 [Daphnia pulex]|uniref:Calcium uniporter protein n=1 Tax=Daphnia pulex TaxID=6669 RepID=E9GD39_DAPPU|nr:hypothetical protein DAPPUDRAFT_240976 [Daphnia pulex]|eukprot:EFX82760.1 hypothetical protein DAPPUDRAFT_240976 [Daphnia pulex]
MPVVPGQKVSLIDNAFLQRQAPWMNFEMAGAERRTTTWAGLALMGVQFGDLVHLTWEEYSWDIMKPITYYIVHV